MVSPGTCWRPSSGGHEPLAPLPHLNPPMVGVTTYLALTDHRHDSKLGHVDFDFDKSTKAHGIADQMREES